jgi:AraC-like DNA-binding protein/ABC-type sugar transport system substrate-binding protein/GAF domain-containing protein
LRLGNALETSDPFWVQVNEAARQRAAELDVTLVPIPLVTRQANDEPLSYLEDLRARELGALITPQLPQSQMLTLLEHDFRVICTDETPLRHPRLVSPQGLYDAATLATEHLVARLNAQGHILLVGGPEQNPYTARVRLNGFRDTVQRYPTIHHTRIPTLWHYEEVYAQLIEDQQLWQAAIGRGVVDGIFGLSDSVALAARDAGRRLGFVDDHTLVVGINGDPLAVAAILQGTMVASVETSPHDFGRRLIELGISAVRGEPLPATFPFLMQLITPANATDVAARKLVDIAALPNRLVNVNVQQERQRLKQMETSLELNRHIGAILEEDELLRTLADTIRSRYVYDRVQLLLWEADAQRLVLVEPQVSAAERTPVALTEPLRHALLGNRVVYIPDALNSMRFAPDPCWPDLRTRVLAPIRLGGRTLGLLDLHSRSCTVRSQAELDALQMLADQVGSAMQNVERYTRALESSLAAERASQMKSQVLAAISQDLREPLNIILGYSRAALLESSPDGAPLPSTLQHDLRRIAQRSEELLRVIDSMVKLAQAETTLSPLALRAMGHAETGENGVGAARSQGDLALVQKVYDFVAAQYVTPFTRVDLARALGVSEAYVSRVFRRVTGNSLWEYVNQYRIGCACELLERTAMSVTEIALAVGYSDPAYFSRIFRSATGHSPQQYRKYQAPYHLPMQRTPILQEARF